MKAIFYILCVVCHFSILSEHSGAEPSGAEAEGPVSKTLSIKAPGKISHVFWTVQPDLCSIQISFPGVPEGQDQPEHPRTQAWLLKADGTVIPQSNKPATVSISMTGEITDSIFFTFPASAQTEALAVVLCIDNQLFTERLLPNAK